ncbi:MAG TPA: DUF2786 domain-containing protein [Kofleriaceae bacterium]|nr:DUF2786 domain-containing protein [Kofleriaceae bacterium]
MLSIELEAALVRELRRAYERTNTKRFAGKLKPAVLVLGDTTKRLGQWSRATRRLELSRTLVLERPWLEVISVLEHEMAHQFVDEVLGASAEPAHGPTFQRVCAERGIDARAAGAPIAAADAEGERALDKIRKLMALAGSANEHEAEIAMRRAHELMLRHNIEQARSGGANVYEVRQLGEPTRRANAVELDIVGLLTECFFVEVIRVPVYVAATASQAEVFEVIGTRTNLDMALHVFEFMRATAQRLWEENRRDARVKSGRDRRAYQSGVVRGFREKLVASRTSTSQGTSTTSQGTSTSQGASTSAGASEAVTSEALVWSGDDHLDAFFRARYPRIRRRRRFMTMSSAHAAGREAGRTVILHKPVTRGPSDGSPRLLRD